MSLRRILATLIALICCSFVLRADAVTAVKIAICQILVIDSDREGNFRRMNTPWPTLKPRERKSPPSLNPQFSAGRILKPTASPSLFPAPTVREFKTSLRNTAS